MKSLTNKMGMSLLLGILAASGLSSFGYAAGNGANSIAVNGTVKSPVNKLNVGQEEWNTYDAAQVQERVDKVKELLKAAEQRLKEVKSQFRDVPYSSIDSKLMMARSALAAEEWGNEQRSLKERGKKLKELERFAQEAYNLSAESRKVELRGIWIEPQETNAEQVREHIQRIKSAHLNAIYIAAESAASSHRIAQSTDVKFAAFDPVQVYGAEGAKLGVAVFAVNSRDRGRILSTGGIGTLGVAITDHPVWTVAAVKLGEHEAATEKLLQEQRSLHGAGLVIIDEKSYFNGTVDWQWWMGVYRSPAVLPDYRSAQPIGLLLEQMSRKIGSIYVPLHGIREDAATRYKSQLDQLSSSIYGMKKWDKNGAQSIRGILNNLREDIGRDWGIEEEVKLRMSFDIEEGIALCDAYLAQ
ncbi:hypothetical protein [Paenibacillus sp. S-12]|uniref:hypothetical protein n=1 Tax=unclassified Paenibacillus TaxID=185978 RepID=UPI0025A0EF8A|nr:hypothetical protein [Paenibacillus sp. S-12]